MILARGCEFGATRYSQLGSRTTRKSISEIRRAREELRGSSVGTEILRTAESVAMERGCRAVILDTLSFQAPDFYEKRGYVCVGIIDNYRGGMQHIFLQKKLM